MGVLSDFIIATEPEALEYFQDRDSISEDILHWKSFSHVELSTLLAILNGKPWDKSLLRLFPNVTHSEESWLTRVADELLERLSVAGYDLDKAAAAWAATDEMRCTPAEARDAIEELAKFAARAKELGKPVYLWNCL